MKLRNAPSRPPCHQLQVPIIVYWIQLIPKLFSTSSMNLVSSKCWLMSRCTNLVSGSDNFDGICHQHMVYPPIICTQFEFRHNSIQLFIWAAEQLVVPSHRLIKHYALSLISPLQPATSRQRVLQPGNAADVANWWQSQVFCEATIQKFTTWSAAAMLGGTETDMKAVIPAEEGRWL